MVQYELHYFCISTHSSRRDNVKKLLNEKFTTLRFIDVPFSSKFGEANRSMGHFDAYKAILSTHETVKQGVTPVYCIIEDDVVGMVSTNGNTDYLPPTEYYSTLQANEIRFLSRPIPMVTMTVVPVDTTTVFNVPTEEHILSLNNDIAAYFIGIDAARQLHSKCPSQDNVGRVAHTMYTATDIRFTAIAGTSTPRLVNGSRAGNLFGTLRFNSIIPYNSTYTTIARNHTVVKSVEDYDDKLSLKTTDHKIVNPLYFLLRASVAKFYKNQEEMVSSINEFLTMLPIHLNGQSVDLLDLPAECGIMRTILYSHDESTRTLFHPIDFV